MKKYKILALTITLILLASFYMTRCSFSSSCYTMSYYLLENYVSQSYKLNIAIPQSLYEYYLGKDHRQASVQDFAKFVTPYPLKPIADRLWEIYEDPEDFANAVLMIVHQIPYSATGPAKYPIEIIVDNRGDCDLFSYVAASVMKAGGLDVVLLYYEDEAHMNVGVYLPKTPRHSRFPISYVTYNGFPYYIAECTGDNWKEGWRVGECPEELQYANCQVITLENCEKWAPEQVSASYSEMQKSSITLTVSSTFTIQGSTITFTGQLLPKLQNMSVTIYYREGSFSWSALTIVETNADGKFSWVWHANGTGIFQFRASWSGNENYAGADSPILTVTVFSTFFILLFVITLVLICVGIAIILMSPKGLHEIKEPELPKISL